MSDGLTFLIGLLGGTGEEVQLIWQRAKQFIGYIIFFQRAYDFLSSLHLEDVF